MLPRPSRSTESLRRSQRLGSSLRLNFRVNMERRASRAEDNNCAGNISSTTPLSSPSRRNRTWDSSYGIIFGSNFECDSLRSNTTQTCTKSIARPFSVSLASSSPLPRREYGLRDHDVRTTKAREPVPVIRVKSLRRKETYVEEGIEKFELELREVRSVVAQIRRDRWARITRMERKGQEQRAQKEEKRLGDLQVVAEERIGYLNLLKALHAYQNVCYEVQRDFDSIRWDRVLRAESALAAEASEAYFLSKKLELIQLQRQINVVESEIEKSALLLAKLKRWDVWYENVEEDIYSRQSFYDVVRSLTKFVDETALIDWKIDHLRSVRPEVARKISPCIDIIEFRASDLRSQLHQWRRYFLLGLYSNSEYFSSSAFQHLQQDVYRNCAESAALHWLSNGIERVIGPYIRFNHPGPRLKTMIAAVFGENDSNNTPMNSYYGLRAEFYRRLDQDYNASSSPELCELTGILQPFQKAEAGIQSILHKLNSVRLWKDIKRDIADDRSILGFHVSCLAVFHWGRLMNTHGSWRDGPLQPTDRRSTQSPNSDVSDNQKDSSTEVRGSEAATGGEQRGKRLETVDTALTLFKRIKRRIDTAKEDQIKRSMNWMLDPLVWQLLGQDVSLRYLYDRDVLNGAIPRLAAILRKEGILTNQELRQFKTKETFLLLATGLSKAVDRDRGPTSTTLRDENQNVVERLSVVLDAMNEFAIDIDDQRKLPWISPTTASAGDAYFRSVLAHRNRLLRLWETFLDVKLYTLGVSHLDTYLTPVVREILGEPSTTQMPAEAHLTTQSGRPQPYSLRPGIKAPYWNYTQYQGANQEMPTVHLCSSVESTERILKKYFMDQSVLGFDMEWKMWASDSDGPRANVSLIQIASEQRIGLFHIARYHHQGKEDTVDDFVAPTLRKIMESQDITKVGVSIKADCTRLRKFLKIDSKGLLELSHLYKLVKYSQANVNLINKRLVSLSVQVQELLGLPLWKGDVRTSDWTGKLGHEQTLYAASDPYACIQLYHTLELQRKALRPTPPRPEFVERNQPIVLAHGEHVAFLDGATDGVQQAESDHDSAWETDASTTPVIDSQSFNRHRASFSNEEWSSRKAMRPLRKPRRKMVGHDSARTTAVSGSRKSLPQSHTMDAIPQPPRRRLDSVTRKEKVRVASNSSLSLFHPQSKEFEPSPLQTVGSRNHASNLYARQHTLRPHAMRLKRSRQVRRGSDLVANNSVAGSVPPSARSSLP